MCCFNELQSQSGRLDILIVKKSIVKNEIKNQLYIKNLLCAHKMAAAEKLKSFSKKKLVYARAPSSIDSSSCGRVFESRKVKIRNLGKAHYSERREEHCVCMCVCCTLQQYLYACRRGPWLRGPSTENKIKLLSKKKQEERARTL